MNAPPILALAGPAGCGKSTLAAYLAEAHGFARVRFAGPLKAMLAAYLDAAGLDAAAIAARIEGDLKELPCPVLGDRSPRYAMQRLGTEWGRDLMHPDFWVRAWGLGVEAALARGAAGVVVEDCRFANEAAALHARGGLLVGIVRPGASTLAAGHVSEGQTLPLDEQIINDGSLARLHARADALVERFARLAA